MNVLKLPRVEEKTSLSHSSIYKLIEAGEFPKPVPLIGRHNGWLEHEIDLWILERIAERDEKDVELLKAEYIESGLFSLLN